jgi:hypothetical protein
MNRSVDMSKPGSMFHATKNWLSPKAKKLIKESFYQQVAMTNRLSTPKGQTRRRALEMAASQNHTANVEQQPSMEPAAAVGNNLASIASGASLRASIITRAKNRRYGGRNLGAEGGPAYP